MTASFFNIGQLRIFLYAALPGFGTLATSVALLTPLGVHTIIIMYVNIVPTFVYMLFFGLFDKYRHMGTMDPVLGPTLLVLVSLLGNVILWLPVAHHLGKFLEWREKR